MQFVEDLPVVGEPIAFVRTFLKILREPVAEPIRLVETPEYRGHFRFLMIGTGVFVAFVVLALGAARNQNNQGPLDPSQASYLDNYLYTLLINYSVGAVIAYGLFRLFGRRNAGVVRHAKLWSILTGFYLPLQMLLLIVIALVGFAIIQVHPELETSINTTFQSVGPWFFLTFNAVMCWHFAIAHARIWDTRLWLALVLVLACVFLARYPAYAIQYAFGFVVGYFKSLGGAT